MKLIFATTAVAIATATITDWNYDTKDKQFGPEAWVNTYPDCGRSKQSPINMKGKYTTYKRREALPDHTVVGLPERKTKSDFSMTNTGTALEITGAVMDDIIISGGGMDKEYGLKKVVFHWADSEHSISGNRQEAELQFIFEDLGGNPEAAEGRLHMAVLIDSKKSSNKDLDGLFDEIEGITAVGAVDDVSFDLNELLPRDWDEDYWTYAGSLTHPPCTQNVQWVVCRNLIQMGKSQLKSLRTLMSNHPTEDQDDDGLPTIEDNARPIQKLNSRHIFKSFSGKGGTSYNKAMLNSFETMLNGGDDSSSSSSSSSSFGKASLFSSLFG